jgi:hypothetical protein
LLFIAAAAVFSTLSYMWPVLSCEHRFGLILDIVCHCGLCLCIIAFFEWPNHLTLLLLAC